MICFCILMIDEEQLTTSDMNNQDFKILIRFLYQDYLYNVLLKLFHVKIAPSKNQIHDMLDILCGLFLKHASQDYHFVQTVHKVGTVSC